MLWKSLFCVERITLRQVTPSYLKVKQVFLLQDQGYTKDLLRWKVLLTRGPQCQQCATFRRFFFWWEICWVFLLSCGTAWLVLLNEQFDRITFELYLIFNFFFVVWLELHSISKTSENNNRIQLMNFCSASFIKLMQFLWPAIVLVILFNFSISVMITLFSLRKFECCCEKPCLNNPSLRNFEYLN